MAVSNQANQKPRCASLNPDDMVQGGLADDFDGHVTLRYVPWTYPDGSMDHYMLAIRADYVPDPESGLEPFPEYYGCGNKSLLGHVPSMDGENPSGATFEEYQALATGEAAIDKDAEHNMEGIFALPVLDERGRKKAEELNSNSKAAEWLSAVAELVKSSSPSALQAAGWTGWSDNLETLSLYGHFNRVLGRERGGLQRQEGKRKPMILVMTELKAKPKGSSGTAAASKPGSAVVSKPAVAAASAPAPAATSQAATPAADGDFRTRLADAVVWMIGEKGTADADSGFKSLSSKKLPGLLLLPEMLKQFDGTERRDAVNTIMSQDFLTSDLSDGRWMFDPSNGIVTALG